QGLAVPLGMSAAEVALELFLGAAAFVVSDEHALDGADAPEAADDGRIVAETAVAVKFGEVAAEAADVVAALRPAGVAGDADRVPRAELRVEVGEERVSPRDEILLAILEIVSGLLLR